VSQPEGQEDYIKAPALQRLLEDAGTTLVVIASGDSLPLISHLLPVAHVISPQGRISAKQMARWVSEFYDRLWTTTLVEACEMATLDSGAVMTFMTKNPPAEKVNALNSDTARAGRTLPGEPATI
jgi:hypothetical protein